MYVKTAIKSSRQFEVVCIRATQIASGDIKVPVVLPSNSVFIYFCNLVHIQSIQVYVNSILQPFGATYNKLSCIIE